MYLISQPTERLSDRLNHLLNNEEFDSFAFCVAYAKISGINLIGDKLNHFVNTGGTATAIIGIDQKNTSIEAIQSLLALCTSVYIFHGENFSQTFHPKFYFFDKNNQQSELIVGSG